MIKESEDNIHILENIEEVTDTLKKFLKEKCCLEMREKIDGEDVIIVDLWGLENPIPYYEATLDSYPFMDNCERFAVIPLWVIAYDGGGEEELQFLYEEGVLYDVDKYKKDWIGE